MRKRIFSTIIALLAIAGMARAATDYGLLIGNVRVTSDNYQNINSYLGAVLKGGSVSFDPQTATLTLNNATIDGGSYPALDLWHTYFERFRVKLVGSNYLTGYQAGVYLRADARVILDGPGQLYVSKLYLNADCITTVRNVQQLDISTFTGQVGCRMEVFASKVVFYSAVSGLASFTTWGALLDSNYYFDTSQGSFVYKNTGAVSSQAIINPFPSECDFNGDGQIDNDDISLWSLNRTGYYNYPHVADVKGDLNNDGKLDAADLTTLNNLKCGYRPPKSRALGSLKNMSTNQTISPDENHTIIFNDNNTTETWGLVDDSERGNKIVDDPESSHFNGYCVPSSVADVSVVPITIYGNVTTYGFQVNVKERGNAVVYCNYDDGVGNAVKLEIPISCFKSTDVFASGDRIYALESSNVGMVNMEMKSNMNVPVGTTMRLTIDKALSGGYDPETKAARVTCAQWEVTSGSTDVKIEKTTDYFVNVYVGTAGPFTITATDKNNKKLSATFKAYDVYTYTQEEVCKNGKTYLCAPKGKGSSILGINNKVGVLIKKMVTYKNDVYTLVDHGVEMDKSLLGQTEEGAASKYVVPVYAQVYRNEELIYESEATYLEDIAFNNSDAMVVVGWKYDPNIEFGKHKGRWSGATLKDEMYSLRVSGFYAMVNLYSGDIQEYSNPIAGQTLENRLQAVAYDPNTNEWCLLGFAARKKTAWGEELYPHDWFFQRWNSTFDHTTQSYRRKANDNYTYRIKGLTIANNKPVGLISCIRYKHSEATDMFLLDKYLPDQLFYDFSKIEDGGTLAIEETVSSDGRTQYPMLGITSADAGSSLHGWSGKYVFDFTANLQGYEKLAAEGVLQRKFVKNSSSSEDECQLLYHSDGRYCSINSDWGEIRVRSSMTKGFDLMTY